jgi:cytoskeletal protein CcmA (bactofilin family)
MGLFNKKEDTIENKPATVSQETRVVKKNKSSMEKDPIASVIAKEMNIVGEISFKGKARFDGIVEGNIKGEYLILSDTAKVTGNIDVTTLVCHGTVDGNIVADVVTAHTTSAIHGILKSANLTVESGASLDGEIHASSRKLQRREKLPDSTRPQIKADSNTSAKAEKK